MLHMLIGSDNPDDDFNLNAGLIWEVDGVFPGTAPQWHFSQLNDVCEYFTGCLASRWKYFNLSRRVLPDETVMMTTTGFSLLNPLTRFNHKYLGERKVWFLRGGSCIFTTK